MERATLLVYESSCPPPGSLVQLAGADTAFPAIGVLGCGMLDETILAPGKTVTAGQLVILLSSAGAGKRQVRQFAERERRLAITAGRISPDAALLQC